MSNTPIVTNEALVLDHHSLCTKITAFALHLVQQAHTEKSDELILAFRKNDAVELAAWLFQLCRAVEARDPN